MDIILVLGCMQFILALSAAEQGAATDLEEWNNFKVTYRKTYGSKEVEDLRMKIFCENKKRIDRHNEDYERGLVSFTTGVNRFSDLTSSEFKIMRGYSSLSRRPAARNSDVLFGRANVPRSLDWRNKGAVTGVKDQGDCLSCWVFSAVGAVESQHFLKTGELVLLSEQNVLDCFSSSPVDGENCPIGWMDTAFEYIQSHGVDTEESYPYEGKVAECRFNESAVGATIAGYVDLPSGDESALKRAVAKVGPVSVAIDATDGDFMHYKSGVYFSKECKNSVADLDHSVLVVGYGKEDDLAYWLVKNSWGTSWGEGGFGKIARNKDNHCGIATKGSYPNIV